VYVVDFVVAKLFCYLIALSSIQICAYNYLYVLMELDKEFILHFWVLVHRWSYHRFTASHMKSSGGGWWVKDKRGRDN
jgi:hypothetical protein